MPDYSDVRHQMVKARELRVGDVLWWVTKRHRTIVEVKAITIRSKFYPYRPYKGIAARFKGSEDFTYTQGASTWVCIRVRDNEPGQYAGKHRAPDPEPD